MTELAPSLVRCTAVVRGSYNGLINDVRPAGSLPLSWYIQVSIKMATGLSRDALQPIGLWYAAHWKAPNELGLFPSPGGVSTTPTRLTP